MTVSVLVPWSPGCPWREHAWAWCRRRYENWEIIEGRSGVEPFSRTRAILDAAGRATGDIFVIPDADVFVDDLAPAIDAASVHGWAVPHELIHRLSPESTELVLAGADWRGLPLSRDNAQDRRPYRGNEAGTLLVISREAFEMAPPDARFVGWGGEDTAWACALRCLVGPPWRGTADLVHCWHPAQPRASRVRGNSENWKLYQRYRSARRDPVAMRALLAEAQSSSCQNN